MPATNTAADWIVNDICIDGTSQFVQSGDVPGDMFATSAIDSFVKFHHPGTRIEVIVTYIGLNKSGCCFTARALGTVVRDDLQQPPPDVRAVIRTSGEALEEEVVVRCDWRAVRDMTKPRTLRHTHAPDHELSVNRDSKLLKLLDAARQLVEVSDSVPRFHVHHVHALDALEAAARAWTADECSICGRRGDHEWDELTITERAAHMAEADAQGT
jgi:hypothetical protein